MNRIIAIILLSVINVYADTPLPTPSKVTGLSVNGQYEFVSDPQSGTRATEVRTGNILWTIDDWFRWCFLADDGSHFVTGYNGLNLIPQNYKKDLVLITFWKNGTKIREVTIEEIIPNLKILEKTVSHYHWGTISGFTKNRLIEILLVNNERIFYDPKTGNKTEQHN